MEQSKRDAITTINDMCKDIYNSSERATTPAIGYVLMPTIERRDFADLEREIWMKSLPLIVCNPPRAMWINCEPPAKCSKIKIIINKLKSILWAAIAATNGTRRSINARPPKDTGMDGVE